MRAGDVDVHRSKGDRERERERERGREALGERDLCIYCHESLSVPLFCGPKYF